MVRLIVGQAIAALGGGDVSADGKRIVARAGVRCAGLLAHLPTEVGDYEAGIAGYFRNARQLDRPATGHARLPARRPCTTLPSAGAI